jgi:NADPH:quinone reductase-like Zn-dependent oxidoreductase
MHQRIDDLPGSSIPLSDARAHGVQQMEAHMKACVYEQYGSADVVSVSDVERPTPKPGELLVKVAAASVTTADWRFRSASFPGGFALAGRLMLGVFRPRHRVLGMDFAGEVAAVGEGAQGFRVGERIFGSTARGAHAEYVTVRADGAITRTPANLTDDEAAAVPFGANSALAFLRDFVGVRAGQRVLVVGASGGVGVWAVQLAKHLGAEVTGVASARNRDLMLSLGATRALDYAKDAYLSPGAGYDLVFDTLGVTTFAQAKPALARTGTYLPLTAGFREIAQSVLTRFGSGPRVKFAIGSNTRALLEANAALLADGTLRPVVDEVFPIERIVDAHRRVEGRHKRGSVIVQMTPAARGSSSRCGGAAHRRNDQERAMAGTFTCPAR